MADITTSQIITRSRHSSLNSNSTNEPVRHGQDVTWSDFDQQGSAIKTIQTLLEAIKTESPFEIAMVQAVNHLAECHVKLLSDVKSLTQKVTLLSTQTGESVISSNQALQYSRRDTVVVTGMPYTTGEKPEVLGKTLATELSNSGVTVSENDFGAYHRNGNKIKTKVIKDRSGTEREIKIPPSVTVRFNHSNLKDNVIRNYKNFDSTKRVPKKIRVYQSTTPYYSNLKKEVSKFLTEEADIRREIQWVHWRSPTCGIAVKCKDGTYYGGIHCIDDLLHNSDYS